MKNLIKTTVYIFLVTGFSVKAELADTLSAQTITVIHAGTLLANASKSTQQKMSVVIEHGDIKEIRKGYLDTDDFDHGASISIIDLKEKFVMPGLIDSHVHLQIGNTASKGPDALSDAELTIHGTHSARLTLEAGFTTVRDVGSANESIFALRDAINAGLIRGPRVLASGEALSITGGHGSAFCDSPTECQKTAREQIRLGADLIKIAATAGGNGYIDDLPEMYLDDMKASVDAAHRLRRKAAAHAHSILGIKQAIAVGIDSIEHGTFIDKAAAKSMKSKGVFLVPTLMVRDNLSRDIDTMSPALQSRVRLILDSTVSTMNMAYKIGVRFASGSDAGVVNHGDNAKELEWLVKIGMTPKDALIAATINAAELLGLQDTVGTLTIGMSADIIALSNNPLQDITALQKVDFVMKSGEVFAN